jgi:serine/threonine protein phosphatase PrpC
LSPATKELTVTSAGATHVGLHRLHNEDSFQIVAWLDLYVVADGMGGHRSGDVASRLATEALSEAFQEQIEEAPTVVTQAREFDVSPNNILVSAVQRANQHIFEHGLRNPACRGMGTTVVAATYYASSNQLHIAHVGDSRAYRVRAGELQQLTQDHSLLNEALAHPERFSERELAEIPRNVITRALGVSPSVEVDLSIDAPESGDTYLLCSDGLHGMVDDPDLLRLTLEAETDSVARLCERMIEQANAHGGDDNITVVVLRFAERSIPEAEPTSSPGG